jgi:transposase
MRSMEAYPRAAMERAMKVQDVMLQAMAKKITWWQAAEILGICDRHLRRWRERYVEQGYNGLLDRRRGKPSRRRVPVATVEQVFALYREKYFDLNVQHFHEKLQAEHGIELSYTWVKQALQGAGLVARGRKRGAHRKRRERRPLPGMLLHIDGSRHQWFQDERWYDLIVILDDATSEIYYAQLVEEESTATVMAGLKEVIERKGVFCALYSDRGSHFWLTPKVGGKVDYHRRTQAGVARVGSADDPGLLAASAWAQRAQLLDLAGPLAAGVAAAPVADPGGGQPVSAARVHRPVQSPFSGRAPAAGQRFCALPES